MTQEDFNSTDMLFEAARHLAAAERMRRDYTTLVDATTGAQTQFERSYAKVAEKRLSKLREQKPILAAQAEECRTLFAQTLEMKAAALDSFDETFQKEESDKEAGGPYNGALKSLLNDEVRRTELALSEVNEAAAILSGILE